MLVNSPGRLARRRLDWAERAASYRSHESACAQSKQRVRAFFGASRRCTECADRISMVFAFCSLSWVPVYTDASKRLAVMSIGFLLKHEDDPVIWRGPKKNGQFLPAVESLIYVICKGVIGVCIVLCCATT